MDEGYCSASLHSTSSNSTSKDALGLNEDHYSTANFINPQEAQVNGYPSSFSHRDDKMAETWNQHPSHSVSRAFSMSTPSFQWEERYFSGEIC